ncbi:MAG: hypothetical protein ACRCSN_05835 [Dermatophilaceae bacterium]
MQARHVRQPRRLQAVYPAPAATRAARAPPAIAVPAPGPASVEVVRPAIVRTSSEGVPDAVGVPPAVPGGVTDVVADDVGVGEVVGPAVPGGGDAEAVADAEGAAASEPAAGGRPGVGPVVDGAAVRGRDVAVGGGGVAGFGVEVAVAAGGAARGCCPEPNRQPSTVPGLGLDVPAPSWLYDHEPPRDACQYDQ